MSPYILALFMVLAGLGQSAMAAETPLPPYVPGVGEIMGATQMRHAKLWFAAQAGNWDLAQYELDEINEGLEDAVTYHPVFKHGAPLAEIMTKFMAKPVSNLTEAINAKNKTKFVQAFDQLTEGCNGCHKAAEQDFIKIKRPTQQNFSNQDFTVWKK